MSGSRLSCLDVAYYRRRFFSHPHLSNNYHTYVARTVSKIAGVDAGLGLTDLPARCNPRIGETQENEKWYEQFSYAM